MRSPGSPVVIAWALLGVLPAAAGPGAGTPAAPPGRRGTVPARRPSPPVPYEAALLPLFRARCGGCHGAGLTHAGLDVRTRGDLVQGGRSGPAVVPGAPEQSRLYQLLAAGKMPLQGRRFSSAELGGVARWIRAGAPGTSGAGGHWAFRPPSLPPVPRPRGMARVRNPIDAFLLERLERRGLSFSPDADRRTLIRRVTFDLVGLPPTPEEVAAFASDRRPDAYERLVDRLLADPRYGERWARHWLDTAGYADSEGVLQEDRIRPNAWRYRDYVIRSLNGDKPYDRFILEQLAGDLLVDYRTLREFTPEAIDTLAATGFLRTAVDGTRDDFNPHQYGEYQYRMLHDTQTIVSSTLLGLTIQCARCHDHKYEPFSQRDYYRLQAIFTPGVRPHGTLLPSARRQIIAAPAAEQTEAAEQNARVDRALADLTRRQTELVREFRQRAGSELSEDALAERFPEFGPRRSELRRLREEEERRRITLPSIRAFYDQDASPPPTPILIRGDWLRPGEPVDPGIPAVLEDLRSPFRPSPPAAGAPTTQLRRALAEWLTRPDHPLTARVMVNRLWAQHFGVGIVATLENFGRSGSPPSHPELLDWLAVHFAAGSAGVPAGGEARPWLLKALHRLIVTSTAYRQSSAWRDAGAVDPDDRLLWRQRPRRLEAEAVRDAVLAAAGTLDPRMFGEPVGIETRPSGETVAVEEAKGGRRSIYLLVRRSLPVTFLNTFDAPVMETNCTRRTGSTTVTQALAQLNGSFLASQAAQLAARLRRETGGGGDSRALEERDPVRRAYLLVFSRAPRPGEVDLARRFLTEQEQRYRGAASPGDRPEDRALADFCQALLGANEFIYID